LRISHPLLKVTAVGKCCAALIGGCKVIALADLARVFCRLKKDRWFRLSSVTACSADRLP